MAAWQRILRQAAIGVSRYRVRRFSAEAPQKGRAALVYLVPSALNGAFLGHHPNLAEVEALCRLLRKRGYAIDAFDYRSRRSVGGYDLVLGFGDAVYRAQRAGAANVVLYATGASANFQHRSVEAVLGPLTDAYGPDAVNHVRIPERYLGISEALSNNILSIGNTWTASTFARPERVLSLPGIFSGTHAPVSEIVASAGNRGAGLAWIGSKGVLHKGLHVVASVAKQLGVHLHAVGIKGDEEAFARKVLERSACRYTMYPFVTPGDAVWMSVVAQCRAVAGASLSEGMSTALLTAARSGLYPVSLETCGLSIGDVVGTNNDLQGAVDAVLALPAAAFAERLVDVVDRVAAGNTPAVYLARLQDALSAIGVGA